jgi:hypothetical protein
MFRKTGSVEAVKSSFAGDEAAISTMVLECLSIFTKGE